MKLGTLELSIHARGALGKSEPRFRFEATAGPRARGAGASIRAHSGHYGDFRPLVALTYSRAVRVPTACLQAVSCIVPCAMAFAMVREAGRFASGKAQAPRPRSAPHTLGTAGLSLQRSSPALFCRRRRRIVQRHTRPHELAYPCSKTSLALLRRLPCCQFRRWRWRCRL